MVEVRNPWGEDTWNGDYNDNSSVWTDQCKEALDFVHDEEDGLFWMSCDDYLSNFYGLYVGYYNDNFVSSYIDD